MDKHAMWKWLVLAALLTLSLSRVIPWKEKVRLGLDLQGGISFVCSVDKDKMEEDLRRQAEGTDATDDQIAEDLKVALKGARDRSVEILRNRLNLLGIEEPSIVAKGERIEIQLPGVGETKREEAKQTILDVGVLEFRMAHEDTFTLTDEIMAEDKAPRGYRVMSIGGGMFYVPTDEVPQKQRDEAFYKALRRFEVQRAGPGYEFMLARREVEGHTVYRPYFIARQADIRGDHLKDARQTTDEWNRPAVSLDFTAQGAARFARLTKQHAPGGALNPDPQGSRYLAIVIDDVLYSAPRINSEIPSGRAQITGDFTTTEAIRLVNILDSGALPTRIRIEDERYVAPSLGRDYIQSGFKAVVLGGALTVLFMAGYYLVCGLVADLALVLNLMLLPLGMIVAAGFLSMGQGVGGSAIQLPVLTLPGIAGILLTIGMAVDANVLIFERIREELRSGKALWPAITAGYDRAFITIFDANLTTLLTGVILFILGSGPIRGFAVTLCAGIIVSMYTALMITKLMFGLIANHTGLKTLKMLSVVGETKIDFVGKRKIAAALSATVIVLAIGLMTVRAMQSPGRIFGVDFTGGSSITYTFAEGMQAGLEEVRDALTEIGVKRPTIQYQRSIDTGLVNSLQIRVGINALPDQNLAQAITSALQTGFPDAEYEVGAIEDVGSRVGEELKQSAIYAIIAALAGIILYLAWRFELGFAVGAIVALAHDVLVTVGLYSLFGQQINLTIVAALLTIVGYSVNDTIVVFDRIREDLKLVKKASFKEICNLSINQTLGRTLLTSVTTLITVVMLLIFGGGAIFGFALALCIGVLVGTYSSIFVATPVVLLWHRDKKPELATTQKPIR